MKNIAIFASGDGSNAEAIVKHFANSNTACVKVVLSNRQKAGVHDRIKALGIPTLTFSKDEWKDCSKILSTLQKKRHRPNCPRRISMHDRSAIDRGLQR